MKILTFILFFILPLVVFGQLNDENSLLINEYFQVVNNDDLVVKTKPNNNIQSYVNLEQTGIENSIYINSLQKDDKQVVNQVGKQNNYKYYNYYSKENSNLNVNQKGNLNSLQVFGENSLMKNAIINQKSNFKSVVIKNYTN